MTSALPYAEVIGDPISHSKSPLIHGFWLKHLGIEGEYRATRISEAELAAFLQQRRSDPRWLGCNVTMPLKLAAASLTDEHRSPEHGHEPVNLIIRRGNHLHGTNTDIIGILDPLRNLDRPATLVAGQRRDQPRSAVVLGSGGVLLSVTRALKSLGYRPVTIIARSKEKVDQLLGPERGQWRFLPWGSEIPACDLLVNATPLGMKGQPALPYDSSSVNRGGAVFDMIYDPLLTPLLAEGRARGLRQVDGLQMLVAQAAPSFEQLFGVAPPREHDAELRALLTQ
jgi:shikimate dehydrogenase